MVRYMCTLEQRVFLNDTRQIIQDLLNKLRSMELLIDKKQKHRRHSYKPRSRLCTGRRELVNKYNNFPVYIHFPNGELILPQE